MSTERRTQKFRTQAQNNRRLLLSTSQPFQKGFENPLTENSSVSSDRNKVLWRPYCHAQIRRSFSPGKPNSNGGTCNTVCLFFFLLLFNVCYAAVDEAGCFSQLKHPIRDFRVECLNCPQVLGRSILTSEVYVTEESHITGEICFLHTGKGCTQKQQWQFSNRIFFRRVAPGLLVQVCHTFTTLSTIMGDIWPRATHLISLEIT